jgi:MFS family permease
MNLASPKADKWTSLVLFALGVAMLAGGLAMDRLEIRRIHPASIPGLVPIMLGAIMMLCAGLLFLSARRTLQEMPAGSLPAESQPAQHDDTGEPGDEDTSSVRNLLLAAAYSTIYALFLVGNMPFALASAIYIAVFYIQFTWKRTATVRERGKQIALGLLFAGIGAYSIAGLFQYGFLVRLP